MAQDPPAARPRPDLTLKISLAGDAGVGKTSLIRRFVTDTFSENYVPTLGTRVSSRTFALADPRWPGSTRTVGASVWDIMGSHQFRDLLKDAFFVNASAAILVCDITRPDTLHSLSQWYEIVASVAGPIPAIVLANKADRREPDSIPFDAVQSLCQKMRWPCFETSAKTGANVDAAFREAATQLLETSRTSSEIRA